VACAAVVMAGESSSTMRYTTTTRPILANQPWNGTVYWDLSSQCEIEDIPHEARCMYVSTNKDCAAKSRIPYLQIAYCHIGNAIPLAYEPPTPLLPLTITPCLRKANERAKQSVRSRMFRVLHLHPHLLSAFCWLTTLKSPLGHGAPSSCTRKRCTHAHLGWRVATVTRPQ
jgi:hypothetical protein